MQRIAFLVSLFFLLHLSSPAQNGGSVVKTKSAALQPVKSESVGFSLERLKRIDDNINEWMKDGRLNGCVALIIRNGKIVYNKAFGYDDLEKTKPLKTDNIFRIASQTKAITSTAIMMLYEEGKFLLDDPVSKYIPEFAKQQVLDKFNAADSTYTTVPAKSEVTIRQLLTHTSGISYPQIGTKEANAIYYKAGLLAGIGVEKGRSLANDVKKIAKLPLMHQPGEKWTYGFNIDILGYLVASKYDRLVNLFEEKDNKLGGEYNGKRLLAKNTVRMMLVNKIGDVNFGANKFGLGFGITTEKGSALLPTPEGVFEWGGAFATTYWADPKENLIGIFYRQLWHTTIGDIANKYKVLVYQALE